MDDGPQAPGNVCPTCAKDLDGATNLTDEALLPKSDDISVCVYCAEILQFDKSLKSEVFPPEDLLDLPDDVRRELMRYRRAIIHRLENK